MRRQVRSLATTAVLVLTIAALADCSGTGEAPAGATRSTSTTTTSRQPSDDPDRPVGVIGIGHSGMTGFNADPDEPGTDAGQYSWATGSAPEVRSIYLRLMQARPETEGHVVNVAVDGSRAVQLLEQAQVGLSRVPYPALVVVMTIDNDIGCDGSDPAHYPQFRAQVRAAVELVVAKSPHTQILVISQLGRPATYAAVWVHDPVVSAGYASGDECALFLSAGRLNRSGLDHLTEIIDGYQAQQRQACQGIPQCHTDLGVANGFKDAAADLTVDHGHLSPSGHARVAELLWPTVAEVLAIS